MFGCSLHQHPVRRPARGPGYRSAEGRPRSRYNATPVLHTSLCIHGHRSPSLLPVLTLAFSHTRKSETTRKARTVTIPVAVRGSRSPTARTRDTHFHADRHHAHGRRRALVYRGGPARHGQPYHGGTSSAFASRMLLSVSRRGGRCEFRRAHAGGSAEAFSDPSPPSPPSHRTRARIRGPDAVLHDHQEQRRVVLVPGRLVRHRRNRARHLGAHRGWIVDLLPVRWPQLGQAQEMLLLRRTQAARQRASASAVPSGRRTRPGGPNGRVISTGGRKFPCRGPMNAVTAVARLGLSFDRLTVCRGCVALHIAAPGGGDGKLSSLSEPISNFPHTIHWARRPHASSQHAHSPAQRFSRLFALLIFPSPPAAAVSRQLPVRTPLQALITPSFMT